MGVGLRRPLCKDKGTSATGDVSKSSEDHEEPEATHPRGMGDKQAVISLLQTMCVKDLKDIAQAHGFVHLGRHRKPEMIQLLMDRCEILSEKQALYMRGLTHGHSGAKRCNECRRCKSLD